MDNFRKKCRIQIAIDDFGSDLSSLQFVKDVPADVLKIDKSLLSQNCENEKERIVLESIFNFAHLLHMRTIAEVWKPRSNSPSCAPVIAKGYKDIYLPSLCLR